MDRDRPIGVFDSGVGGLSILRALRAELPHEDFVYFSDAGHAPYGEKDEEFVSGRSLAIAVDLLERHRIKGLVVACNTATAAAVHLLRARHTHLPLVGVEPALKPAAALTKTGRVAVLATRGTLASAKFQALRDSLRGHADFVLVPCDGLAAAIEHDDPPRIRELCRRYTREAGRFGHGAGEIDTLVLGCTHYPLLARTIADVMGPEVVLVSSAEETAFDVRARLAGQSAAPLPCGRVQFVTSGDVETFRRLGTRFCGPEVDAVEAWSWS